MTTATYRQAPDIKGMESRLLRLASQYDKPIHLESKSTIAPLPEQCRELVDRGGQELHARLCNRRPCKARTDVLKGLEHPESAHKVKALSYKDKLRTDDLWGYLTLLGAINWIMAAYDTDEEDARREAIRLKSVGEFFTPSFEYEPAPMDSAYFKSPSTAIKAREKLLKMEVQQ